MAEKTSLTVEEINTSIKAELKRVFGVDVGFKHVDAETALNYITQVAVQRVKQRTHGKDERELVKKMKAEFVKRGIKI